MRKPEALLFAALFMLLPSLNAIPCPQAVRQISLAAVTGEESGGIFTLLVETRPGSGRIYTSVLPPTGFATQESEKTAAGYAFSSTGFARDECDVLYSIYGDFGTSSIDGPSAGAAMAIATRAALLNKTIRPDVVVTGTVSENGEIGSVGGVIEKSLAAAEAGARYILLPKLELGEALLISSVSKPGAFDAIEVANVQEAERIAFSQKSERFSSRFEPKSKPIPANLQALQPDAGTARFGKVASQVVEGLSAKVDGAFYRGSPQANALQDYFQQEISKYRKLLSMGYFFTAANSAFLLSIDAEYLKVGSSKVDLDRRIGDVQDCINSLSPPRKTRENFHWAVGSDLRRLWASEKLNETLKNRKDEEGYATLRNLLFAYSWCGISRELARNAEEIGGEPVDESLVSSLASQKLSEADEELSSSPTLDYDALWHYNIALQANKSGNYGAALYEATYALSMQKATSERQNLSEAAEKLMAGKPASLWGKIYYGQGAYLYADETGSGTAPKDAYRILKYSSELDKASLQIDEVLNKGGENAVIAQSAATQEAQKPAQGGADQLLAAALEASVAGFGLAVIYRIAKKHEQGVV